MVNMGEAAKELRARADALLVEAGARREAAGVWLVGVLGFLACAGRVGLEAARLHSVWLCCLLLAGFCAGGACCAWVESRRLRARGRALRGD